MLTPQDDEQKSPPKLTDHQGKDQGLRTALNAPVGGSATEALRKTTQD